MRASYRPAFWSVPTLRRQTGMESERGGARTRARNPLFRVQCLRAHPYGRKEALIVKVRQRTDVARADQAGQARPGPFECAACGNRVKSSNTDKFFFWYMSFDNGFMGRQIAIQIENEIGSWACYQIRSGVRCRITAPQISRTIIAPTTAPIRPAPSSGPYHPKA
jgi:hypothetical protein